MYLLNKIILLFNILNGFFLINVIEILVFNELFFYPGFYKFILFIICDLLTSFSVFNFFFFIVIFFIIIIMSLLKKFKFHFFSKKSSFIYNIVISCRKFLIKKHDLAYRDFFEKVVQKNLYKTIFHINSQSYSLNILQAFFKRENFSIMGTCYNLNIFIPHYCFYTELSIAGNCRMCLIEVNGAQKPVASCAVNIKPNIQIKTNSFIVKRAREGILEFLLINHPLDCPVCDQGGECDLQDQALIYGNDRGRFYNKIDLKRSQKDFMLTPFIKTKLTRCILCTRCVRFIGEFGCSSLATFGLTGKGMGTVIGLYTNDSKNLDSELASTITDICPVGALTVKPYALEYRSWDELYIESIDLSDSLCSSIRVYSDLKKITRILPQYNTELEVNWIHDKTRHLTDVLTKKQLGYPLYREINLMWKDFNVLIPKKIRDANIKFTKTSWKNLSFRISLIYKICYKNKFKIFKIKTFLGDYLDIFSLLKLKELCLLYGTNEIFNLSEKVLNGRTDLVNEDFETNYLFKINNFNRFKNIFLININLRIENPVLNSKLRQKVLWDKEAKVFYIGAVNKLTYKYKHLGTTTKNFLKFIEGRHYYFNFLKKSLLNNNYINKPNLLIYSSELKKNYKNSCYRDLFNSLNELNKSFVIAYLPKGASSTASLDLSIDRFNINKKNFNNFYEENKEDICNYFVSCNEFLLNSTTFLKNYSHQLTIYQNNINDKCYKFSDVLAPTRGFLNSTRKVIRNCHGVVKNSYRTYFNFSHEVRDNNQVTNIVYNNLNHTVFKRSYRIYYHNQYILHLMELSKRKRFSRKILSILNKDYFEKQTKNRESRELLCEKLLMEFPELLIYSYIRFCIRRLPVKKFLSIKNHKQLRNFIYSVISHYVIRLFKIFGIKTYEEFEDKVLFKYNIKLKPELFWYINFKYSYDYIENCFYKKGFLHGVYIKTTNYKEITYIAYMHKDLSKRRKKANEIIEKFRKNGKDFFDCTFKNDFEKQVIVNYMANNLFIYLPTYKRYLRSLNFDQASARVSFDFFRCRRERTYLDKKPILSESQADELISIFNSKSERNDSRAIKMRGFADKKRLFIFNKDEEPKSRRPGTSYKITYIEMHYLKKLFCKYHILSFPKKNKIILKEYHLNKLTLLFLKSLIVTEKTDYTYENSESNEGFYDFTYYEKMFNANLLFYDDKQTYKEKCYLTYKNFLLSFFGKEIFLSNNFTEETFRKISYKNIFRYLMKKISFFVKINSIMTYLPLYLYYKQRFKFFFMNDISFYLNFYPFNVISYKIRNFYKKDLLSYYSKNMYLMSIAHFKERSNFSL